VALLVQESTNFSVLDPILSAELQEVVKLIRLSALTEECNHSAPLIISEKLVSNADILVTKSINEAFSDPSYCVVARWEKICLLQSNVFSTKPEVVTKWTEVPETSSYLWLGDGASGAISCLVEERKEQKAISYEGAGSENPNQESINGKRNDDRRTHVEI